MVPLNIPNSPPQSACNTPPPRVNLHHPPNLPPSTPPPLFPKPNQAEQANLSPAPTPNLLWPQPQQANPHPAYLDPHPRPSLFNPCPYIAICCDIYLVSAARLKYFVSSLLSLALCNTQPRRSGSTSTYLRDSRAALLYEPDPLWNLTQNKTGWQKNVSHFPSLQQCYIYIYMIYVYILKFSTRSW